MVMRSWVLVFLMVLAAGAGLAQGGRAAVSGSSAQALDSVMPVRGFCIGVPDPRGVDSFVRFIRQELAPRKVNTLFILVDYHYQFQSHPELADSTGLSKEDAKKIVNVCRESHIRIIPQINMLGHQGWEERPGKLLTVYPQFDETPWVKNPEHYVWPNADNLYCRSYCPLYPGIHDVLFAVIDELCDAFETTAFHAGMDEVFYLGESKCPRCGGRDPAVLFAGEVRALHDHLAQKGRELWIWGDRLIDGKTTGIGMWEASFNNTFRAVDLLPKDVVICDWHYEQAEQTAVYFAMKGFRVVTCPWRMSPPALEQVDDMVRFRNVSAREMKPRFLGIVETTWTSAQGFINGFYGVGMRGRERQERGTAWQCFRDVFARIDSLGK
jgi:hypothetical protein